MCFQPEGGNSPIKVDTDVQAWAWALGFSGVNVCLGIRFWEVHFAWALGFWQFLTKKCVIFDERVKKVTYLLKNSNFGTLKFMKTCPVIRFLGTFCQGIRFGACHTSVHTFIRESPLIPAIPEGLEDPANEPASSFG